MKDNIVKDMPAGWNFSYAVVKNVFFLELVWKFTSGSLKMFVYLAHADGSVS